MLLPPNTTLLLQPVDVGVNRILKANIKSQFRDFMFKNLFCKTKKDKTTVQTFKNPDKNLITDWILQAWPHIEKLDYKKSKFVESFF